VDSLPAGSRTVQGQDIVRFCQSRVFRLPHFFFSFSFPVLTGDMSHGSSGAIFHRAKYSMLMFCAITMSDGNMPLLVKKLTAYPRVDDQMAVRHGVIDKRDVSGVSRKM
jgi:hypothetical protein